MTNRPARHRTTFREVAIGQRFYDPISAEYFVKQSDSMAVMVTGVMALFGAMGTANDVRNRTKYHGNALEALQAQIESQLTQGFAVAAQVPMAPSGTAFDIAGIPLQTGATKAGTVSRQTDSTTDLIHLTYTAAWQDAGGPTSITLHYYLGAR